MTQLKTILCSFCLSCMCMTSFAQIQKGSYNFGGGVGLSLNALSADASTQRDAKLFLSPSVGKFLTNEWLFSVQPIVLVQDINTKLFNLNPNEIFDRTLTQTTLGLGISSRHYLEITDKTRVFGLLNASYSRQFSSVFINSGTTDFASRKLKIDFLNYGIGVGLNVGIRQDVFFEAVLAYNVFHFLRRDFGSTAGKHENITLNCGLNHFMPRFSKADVAADYAFIKKGQQMLGGGFSISKFVSSGTNAWSMMINPKFGQFVTKNLFLSGEMSIQSSGVNGIDNNPTIRLTASTRYYFPIQRRFFIYPELVYTRQDDNAENLNPYYVFNKNELSLGVGGNYFLSKNVALEATFLQKCFNIFAETSNEQRNSMGLVGLGNVGVVYFIR
jgi:hypothetical protein